MVVFNSFAYGIWKKEIKLKKVGIKIIANELTIAAENENSKCLNILKITTKYKNKNINSEKIIETFPRNL